MKGINTNTTILREVKYDSNTGFIYLNNGQIVQRFVGQVIDGAYLQPIDSDDQIEILAEYKDETSGTRIYELAAPETYQDERLPRGYAELEYEDFDSVEAIDGARFDDTNYNHYMER